MQKKKKRTKQNKLVTEFKKKLMDKFEVIIEKSFRSYLRKLAKDIK